MDGPTSGLISDLVDLRKIDLGEIEELVDTDSVLAHSIRRILHEAQRPDEAIAGFNSSV